MQVSPSFFDGRETQETTEYEYADGVLVRAVTTRESAWTEQDRAEILAYRLWQEGLCKGCGHPLAETTTHYELGPEYDAKHFTCRACAALAEGQRARADGKKEQADGQARKWYVVKS